MARKYLSNRIAVPFLLRNRVYRRYWSASTISMFGDQVSSVAMPLAAILVLHAQAAEMGYLTALQWLPSLLFGLHAGAWADRFGQRRLTMIAADLGRGLLLATIPLCAAWHLLSLWQLYGVAFAAGILSLMFNVSDGTLFVSIVEPGEYVDGQSLIYVSRALSFIGGPSIGGLLVQFLTAPLAIVADALSFLGSAFLLHRIRPAEPPPEDGTTGAATGLHFIAKSGIVRATLTGVAVINFFHMMFSTLFLLYAVRDLHMRPGLLGVVLGIGAVGGFLGSLTAKHLAQWVGIGWACVVSCALFTVPLVLVPLAAVAHGHLVIGLLIAAEFISGFGLMLLDITVGSIFAAVIPGALRSRVTRVFQAINYGTRPPGALIGGLLGTVLGLREALWIAVIGGILGALLVLPSPLPRFRLSFGPTAPPPAPPPTSWQAPSEPASPKPSKSVPNSWPPSSEPSSAAEREDPTPVHDDSSELVLTGSSSSMALAAAAGGSSMALAAVISGSGLGLAPLQGKPGWGLASGPSTRSQDADASPEVRDGDVAAQSRENWKKIPKARELESGSMVRPGKFGGRYVCELLVSLADSCAL